MTLTQRPNRRTLIGTALLGPIATTLAAPSTSSGRFVALQEAATPLGEVTAPPWVFIVYVLQDPYTGTVLRPAEPMAGMRYIGAEVEVRNDSQDPLNVTSSSVRIRDTDGYEYIPGTVAGSEPLLANLNLGTSERIRGWIWFAVPEASVLDDIAFLAPSPRLTLPLTPPG